MWACYKGHIDIARMLVGEYSANVDILDTVRAIVRLVYFITSFHLVVFSVVYSWSDFFYFILSKQLFISILLHIYIDR